MKTDLGKLLKAAKPLADTALKKSGDLIVKVTPYVQKGMEAAAPYVQKGVGMKHEAMMRLMAILTDGGMSEMEAIRLIAALLVQESASALSAIEDEPSTTLS